MMMRRPVLIGTAFIGGGAPSTFWLGIDDSVYATWPAGSWAGPAWPTLDAMLNDCENAWYRAKYPDIEILLPHLYKVAEAYGFISPCEP
jgi:hypothetical protein